MKAKYKPVIDGKTLYSWGWSCMRAADALGISRSHLSKCLQGERKLCAELARKLRELPKGEPVTGRYMKCMKKKGRERLLNRTGN